MIIAPAVGDTLVVNVSTDARVSRIADGTWSQIRDGIGDDIDTSTPAVSVSISAATTSTIFTSLRRWGSCANTGGIYANYTSSEITSAKFLIWGGGKGNTFSVSNDLRLINFNPQTRLQVLVGDYNRTNFMNVSNPIGYGSIVDGGWNEFTITNLSIINTTSGGTTCVMESWGSDITNTAPPWGSGLAVYHTQYQRESTYVPKWIITYSESGDTTPPASITGVSNQTALPRAVNFTFTRPADADYGGLYVLVDNVWKHNLSSTATYDYVTNLTAATSHTWSTRTFDTTGNMNATWVNRTVTTAVIPSFPKVMFRFDDGTITQYTYANPILKTYGFNATTYVVKANIGTSSGIMNMSLLNNLYAQGWDIGNHGGNHTDISGVSITMAQQIIQEGQQNITENGMPRAAYHFAYPFGGWDADTVTAAANVNTLTAMTTDIGTVVSPETDLLQLPVTNYVIDTTTLSSAKASLSSTSYNETVVYLFHRISPISGDAYNWSVDNFAGLVNHVYDNGYEVWTISQWYDYNTGSGAAPVSAFSGSPTSGTAPLTVVFTDSSTNTPTSWLWDFGDGDATNSTVQNPVHTYTNAGVYTVKLTATNAAGSDDEEKIDYITALGWTDINFVGYPSLNGTVPLSVGFVSNWTYGVPDSFYWQFGDNSTSTLQNPVHDYTEIGLYNVSLTVTNSTYGNQTVTKHWYINVITFAMAYGERWCGINDLYFQHNPSTSPAGYEELINFPSGNTEVDENVTLKNTYGWVLIDSYITPEELPSVEVINRGLRTYNMYHYVDKTVGTTVANYTVFKRDYSGNETRLYSIETTDINSVTPTKYSTVYVSPLDLNLDCSDRIVIKVYGKTDHSSDVYMHFVYQGSYNTSYVTSGYFVCNGNCLDTTTMPTTIPNLPAGKRKPFWLEVWIDENRVALIAILIVVATLLMISRRRR